MFNAGWGNTASPHYQKNTMSALEQILYWANVNYHPIYEEYLVEEYEKTNGPHFDEHKAREAVDKMYSLDESGDKVKGEHWNIDQVRSAISPYLDKMHDEDTCWDAYVLLNMWWHDMRETYTKRHQNYEPYIIEDAIHWGFDDPDAPHGKVWKYYQAIA